MAATCNVTRLALAATVAGAPPRPVTAGARPRRASLSGVDALTASERRIADLAAVGLSNHEIAGQLFVSVRTVEFHLSGAFRKLGIGSRRELTSALAEPA